jgi:PAS domain S-box-containing protein
MSELEKQKLVSQIEALETEIERAKISSLPAQAQDGESTKFSFLQSPDCEKNLRKFIDSNLVSIIRCTDDGEVVEANEAAATMLGYTVEELNNGHVKTQKLTPPEQQALEEEARCKVLELGRPSAWEKELLRKDGSRANALVAGLTSSGSAPHTELMAFLIDITKKKKLLSELKASEKQFKLLAEAIPQLVWICESSGRTTYLNQRFFEVTILTREAPDNGFLWLSAIHPTDRKKLMKAWESRQNETPFESRVRYLMKDGTARWHIVRAVPIKGENETVNWFGTSTDIDSKVRLQERMLKREIHFRTLANAIPQIVWTANAKGEIEFFNHRWFEYTRLNLDESRNGGWQFLIHPQDRKKYIKEWRSALSSGDSYEMEFRLRRSPATQSDEEPYRWHLARAVALRNPDGDITQWYATWTEIESQMNKEDS